MGVEFCLGCLPDDAFAGGFILLVCQGQLLLPFLQGSLFPGIGLFQCIQPFRGFLQRCRGLLLFLFQGSEDALEVVIEEGVVDRLSTEGTDVRMFFVHSTAQVDDGLAHTHLHGRQPLSGSISSRQLGIVVFRGLVAESLVSLQSLLHGFDFFAELPGMLLFFLQCLPCLQQDLKGVPV